MDTADVVIIGAGAAGLAVARALARRAGTRTVVLDMEPSYAAGSTGKAVGAIKRQFQTAPLTHFAVESTAIIKSFSRTCDVDTECEPPGYLSLIGTQAQLDKHLSEDVLHRAAGVRTEILEPPRVAARWSFIRTDGLLAAVHSPDDLNVDPYLLATGLYREARSGSTTFRFGTRVVGIMAEKGRVTGVETPEGAIHAAAVVNAAGPWAADLCLAAGAAGRPPMDPRRRQIWQVAPGLPIPREIPFVVDVDRRFYIRRYRELLLLSLMDEELGVLAGNEPAFDWNQIYEITDRVEGRIPALAEASVAKGWAGWRTLTPDDAPVLGRVESVPGLYMAAGFGGHGLALAPFCGELVAAEILGEDRGADLAPFRIERFARLPGR
jgi:sarcosine oxidase subunit beta